MTAAPRSTHPRLRSGVFFATSCLACLALARPAAAQDPVPVPPDTVVVVDTIPEGPPLEPGLDAEVAQDTVLVPPPVLVRLPGDSLRDARPGVWIWTRDELQLSGHITLTDLLEDVPGLLAFRSGYYGAAETLAGFAGGAGAVEYTLDGVPLDPIEATALDLARTPIVSLARVRVERRPGRTRIELETLEPTRAEPLSVVEAQAGEPLDLTSFRGLFLAPDVIFGPFGVSFERMGSDGLDGSEPANITSGWLKWSALSSSGDQGLQLGYRFDAAERSDVYPFPGKETRSDLWLRARSARLIGGAVADLTAGASWVEDLVITEPAEEGELADSANVTTRSTHVTGTLGWGNDRVWLRGLGRWRDHTRLPSLEARVEGGIRPVPLLAVSGDARWADWDAGAATALAATAELGPVAGLSLFTELSSGDHAVPHRPDTLGPAPIVTRTGLRAGLGYTRGRLDVRAAMLRLDADSVHAFGPPFDSVSAAYAAGELTGFEVMGRAPTFWDPVSLYGSYVRFNEESPWPYVPSDEGRGGLELHISPLESGNFELIARAEAVRRGPILVPDLAGELQSLPALLTYDGYLQFRIVSVRAFLRYENMTAPENFFIVPGREMPGLRIIYGVKWELTN